MVGSLLKNFQSVREPAFLPIAPLTLLYGPNSAGKSSLGDAIRFLNQFGSAQPSFDVDAHLVRWGNWDRLCERRTRERFVGTSSSIRFWAAVSAGSSGIHRAPGKVDSEILDACLMPLDSIAGKSPIAVSIAFDSITQEDVGSAAHMPFHSTEFNLWIGAETADPLIRLIKDADAKHFRMDTLIDDC